MKVLSIPKISRLTTPEKILFVEELWNSIITKETEIPVPESHKLELEKRHNRYLKSPGQLLSLKELQKRIEKRK